MATVDQRFDSIEKELKELRQFMLEFRTEVVQRLDLQDQAMQLNHSTVLARLTNEYTAQRFNTLDLAKRVAILEEQIAKLLPPAA